MKKASVCATVVLSVLAMSVAASAGETLESVEKKIIAVWDKHTSMSATMAMSTNMEQMGQKMSMKGSGQVEMMKTGDKELSRMEMTSKMDMGEGAAATSIESKSLAIDDGEFTWMLQERMGQKRVIKAKTGKKQQMGGKQMFQTLREMYELKLLPDEKIDGRSVYVLEGVPKQPMPQMPIKNVLMYFDKEYGAMVKMVSNNAGGQAVQTMAFTNIKLNPKLDPKRFVFEIPEGVPVMDRTGVPSWANP